MELFRKQPSDDFLIKIFIFSLGVFRTNLGFTYTHGKAVSQFIDGAASRYISKIKGVHFYDEEKLDVS